NRDNCDHQNDRQKSSSATCHPFHAPPPFLCGRCFNPQSTRDRGSRLKRTCGHQPSQGTTLLPFSLTSSNYHSTNRECVLPASYSTYMLISLRLRWSWDKVVMHASYGNNSRRAPLLIPICIQAKTEAA